MFGWFKRKKPSASPFEIIQKAKEQYPEAFAKPEVVPIEQVITTGKVSVKPTVRFTSPPREPVSSRPRPHVTSSYTPSSVRDGYYQPSADLLTPAVVAAAVVDAGSSSSGWDAGSSSSSCSVDSSSSSGCGGGGCGGGC